MNSTPIPIKINGINYKSIRDASVKLNVSRVTLMKYAEQLRKSDRKSVQFEGRVVFRFKMEMGNG